MSNRNLLLSGQCEVDTKPELEIYTDDVKCAHGSTTGQLDMNAMFYLRTRGISELTARTMLVTAFAQEIIDQVRSRAPSLADYLGNLLNRQLPSNT
jgi:Fe-S cluster assembly protein SufD